MPVISIIISKYLYHPQQKTRTRTTTKKWQKNIFHDHEKKERKNIDYVHVLEDVPIWWHDILLVIGIFAQQAINKDIISLFFWKTSSSSLLNPVCIGNVRYITQARPPPYSHVWDGIWIQAQSLANFIMYYH